MDKQKILDTLLWIVSHQGIGEGEGGKIGEGAGTGLRSPDATLYNTPNTHRKSILKTLKTYGCITEKNYCFYATEKGISRTKKEKKLLIKKTRKIGYIIENYELLIDYDVALQDTNYKILFDFAGDFENIKQDIKQKAHNKDIRDQKIAQLNIDNRKTLEQLKILSLDPKKIEETKELLCSIKHNQYKIEKLKKEAVK